MKIVANIAVRDEVELISENIDYHLSVGFAAIVIANICSNDGTTKKLEAYQDNPQVHIINIDNQDNTVSNWKEALLSASKEIYQPDFIASFDADEFLYSPLHEFLNSSEFSNDLLKIKRFNCISCITNDFSPPVDMSEIDSLKIVKYPPTTHFGQKENDIKIPWLFTQVGSKTICNESIIKEFVDGGHNALDQNNNCIEGMVSNNLVFIHFPMTSFNRFLNKVKNIESLIDMLFQRTHESYAYHWKIWAIKYRELGEQGIREEYLQQIKASTDKELEQYTDIAINCLNDMV